jgi:hypothetical protein
MTTSTKQPKKTRSSKKAVLREQHSAIRGFGGIAVLLFVLLVGGSL